MYPILEPRNKKSPIQSIGQVGEDVTEVTNQKTVLLALRFYNLKSS
jgi:hypothetical protein